jgi:hypothetical protein
LKTDDDVFVYSKGRDLWNGCGNYQERVSIRVDVHLIRRWFEQPGTNGKWEWI